MTHTIFPVKTEYSVVLVNYKSLELTRRCLDLLQAGLQNTAVPIVVVDNNSADDSVEFLRRREGITLIERNTASPEAGNIAHGRALDCALAQLKTEYVFLLHTDTFIYDASVFEMMLDCCHGLPKVAAVGCLEQLDRGVSRTAWRLLSRFFKHYTRRSLRALGLNARQPKPFKETHLKSFCTLWNVQLMKKHNLCFQMDDRNPGYELQDRMSALGYPIRTLSPRKLFRYLDHIQSGTVAAMGGYADDHRRARMYGRMTS
ncbi:glycosyltransferase [Pseudomonas sp. S5F11]|uniref:glycosyltransferase n=1 Tax=Pseudomonas sp. S5F11 TaxID=2866385 RepID=UPI001C7D51F8|nr:glycosyltransferase [Pseudomonas sp. S5F11]MBX4134997.1 glycosyltransferase [Pseudomonas sp. S5F11]